LSNHDCVRQVKRERTEKKLPTASHNDSECSFASFQL